MDTLLPSSPIIDVADDMDTNPSPTPIAPPPTPPDTEPINQRVQRCFIMKHTPKKNNRPQ